MPDLLDRIAGKQPRPRRGDLLDRIAQKSPTLGGDLLDRVAQKTPTEIPAGLDVTDDYVLTGTPTTEGEYMTREGVGLAGPRPKTNRQLMAEYAQKIEKGIDIEANTEAYRRRHSEEFYKQYPELKPYGELYGDEFAQFSHAAREVKAIGQWDPRQAKITTSKYEQKLKRLGFIKKGQKLRDPEGRLRIPNIEEAEKILEQMNDISRNVDKVEHPDLLERLYPTIDIPPETRKAIKGLIYISEKDYERIKTNLQKNKKEAKRLREGSKWTRGTVFDPINPLWIERTSPYTELVVRPAKGGLTGITAGIIDQDFLSQVSGLPEDLGMGAPSRLGAGGEFVMNLAGALYTLRVAYGVAKKISVSLGKVFSQRQMTALTFIIHGLPSNIKEQVRTGEINLLSLAKDVGFDGLLGALIPIHSSDKLKSILRKATQAAGVGAGITAAENLIDEGEIDFAEAGFSATFLAAFSLYSGAKYRNWSKTVKQFMKDVTTQKMYQSVWSSGQKAAANDLFKAGARGGMVLTEHGKKSGVGESLRAFHKDIDKLQGKELKLVLEAGIRLYMHKPKAVKPKLLKAPGKEVEAKAAEKIIAKVPAKPVEAKIKPVPAEKPPPVKKPPVKPVEKPTKEAWEMTKAEHGNWYKAEFQREFGKPLEGMEILTPSKQHEFAVEQAVEQGKPVPAEVLKDYPDLVKAKAVEKIKGAEHEWEGMERYKDKEAWQVPKHVFRHWFTPAKEEPVGIVFDKVDHHKAIIEQAIIDKKNVPADILFDYPDLARKYGKQIKTPEYPTVIKQALVDWSANRAYIDNKGNYHIRKAGTKGKGPIAPWNKEVKKYFASATELHEAAEKYSKKPPRGTVAGLPREANLKETVIAAVEKPKIEIATPQQRKYIHIIKEKKKLSIRQYRRLLKIFTGKSSISYRTPTGRVKKRAMTKQEASRAIDAILGVVSPPGRAPVIPMKKAITPPGFYERKFRKPTLIKYITPSNRYARTLGVHDLIEPSIKGKTKLILEKRKMFNWVDRLKRKWVKEKKISLFELKKAAVRGKPAPKEIELYDNLNNPNFDPKTLPEAERKILSPMRDCTKKMLIRVNEIRELYGLEPIIGIKGYIHHIYDILSSKDIRLKYPFPEDLKHILPKLKTKHIYNPTAIHRVWREEGLLRDPFKALKVMISVDLKQIYLEGPLFMFREQIEALQKGITAEGLPVIPAETRQWAEDFVNVVIKGYPTPFDKLSNATIETLGIDKILNLLLRPFGKDLGLNPMRSIAIGIGRLIHDATIWGRVKLVIRNHTQKLLGLGLYDTISFVQAMGPENAELKSWIDNSEFYQESHKLFMEELPAGALSKLEKIGFAPYGHSHAGRIGGNVPFTMKQAYHYGKRKGWSDDVIRKEMDYGAMTCQYWYNLMGLPELYRSGLGKIFGRLQTWWMNYFTNYWREMLHRSFKGETGYGRKLGKIERLGVLRHILASVIFIEALRRGLGLDYSRTALFGVFPSWISPPGQIVIGLYNLMVAKTNWQRAKAKRRIKQSWRAFIPGSMAWKDVMKVWRKEKPFRSLFLYEEYEEKRTPKKYKTVKQVMESRKRKIRKAMTGDRSKKRKAMKYQR